MERENKVVNLTVINSSDRRGKLSESGFPGFEDLQDEGFGD
jgi:hypothetical protein